MSETATTEVQLPKLPEKTKTVEADGLQSRAETLFKNSQARTLQPAYWMREAEVQHTDPIKKLVATVDAASNTTFLVESYPIEGSKEDRYVLIKWEKTDPNGIEQGVPSGWVRVVYEQGKDPYLGLARHADEHLDGILPHGKYLGDPTGRYELDAKEIRELSPEALQNVLSRLNNSQVSAELTEKYWQLAEADRLLDEWANVSNKVYHGTFWAGQDQERWKVWAKAAAYEHELDMQYVQFCEKYNLPHRKPIWEPKPDWQPTQAEIDEAIATVTAWHAAHPADQRDARTQNYAADFAKWLGMEGSQVLSGVSIPQDTTQADEQRAPDEERRKRQEAEELRIQENRLLLKEQELREKIEAWKRQRNPNNSEELHKTLEQELQALPETSELAKVRTELEHLHSQTQ